MVDYSEDGRGSWLANRILAGIFLVFVVVPLPLTLVRLFATSEAPAASIHSKAVAGAPEREAALTSLGAFRDYVSERFAMRDDLIELHGRLKVEALGVTSNSRVMLGADGWLFLAGDGVLDYERQSKPLTEAEVTAWASEIGDRARWLDSLGIPYLFVVAPNKHRVYSDMLPADLAPSAEVTRADQVLGALAATPGVDCLDLRPVLLRARSAGRVFHKTDTHWNLLGSHFAAEAIAARLGVEFPGAGRVPPFAERDAVGGDLARMLGLARSRRERDIVPDSTPAYLSGEDGEQIGWTHLDVVRRLDLVVNTAGKEGRALVLRDSFGEALLPWLSPCFGRSRWRWTYMFDREEIKRERPDYVIQLLVERRFTADSPEDLRRFTDR